MDVASQVVFFVFPVNQILLATLQSSEINPHGWLGMKYSAELG
jgi:hypothetical protein